MPTINGTEGNDQLWGTVGDDVINGFGGDDNIYGGGGFDTVDSGDGNDALEVGNGNFSSGAGDDAFTFVSSTVNSTFNFGSGNDFGILQPGSGVTHTVTTGSGRDIVDARLRSGGVFVFTDFQPGQGGDAFNFIDFYYRFGQWWFPVTQYGVVQVTNPFGAGLARLQDSASGAVLQLRQNSSADWTTVATFNGTTAAQFTADNFLGWSPSGAATVGSTLYLTERANFFQTTDTFGDDIVYGTDAGGWQHYTNGNDIFYLGGGNDQIFGIGLPSGFKTIYGGAGNDRITIGGFNFWQNNYASGAFSVDGLVYGGDGDDVIGGGSQMYGEAGNDQIAGSNRNDYLDGGAGDDEINGGIGADLLKGGSGNDILRGAFPDVSSPEDAGGFDTVTYSDSTSGIAINLSNAAQMVGGQSVAAGTGRDGFGGTDTFSRIEGVIGSAYNDVIYGSSGNFGNVLQGGAGDDILHDMTAQRMSQDLVIRATSGIVDGEAARFRVEVNGQVVGTFTINPVLREPWSNWAVSQNFSISLPTDLKITSIKIFHLNDVEGSPQGNKDMWLDLVTLDGFRLGGGNSTYTPDGRPSEPFNGGLYLGGVASLDVSAYNSNPYDADRFEGGDGNDQLYAAAGDDILIGGKGSDTLSGGAGVDKALYSGLFKSYAVQLNNAGGTVAGGPEGGTDTLTSVERLEFQDGFFVFDVNGVAAQVARLYDLVLHRVPEQLGLDYWVDQIEDFGKTIKDVAEQFLASGEFQRATGNLNNTQYVQFLYQNGLGRSAGTEEVNYWNWRLSNGTTRADLLVEFSESQEHRVIAAQAVNLGFFNTNDHYQAVALLYDSFAGRLPDAAGLIYWAETLKAGTYSLQQVAANFANSAEFQGQTSGMNNAQLVQYMYLNTLDRSAGAEEVAYWAWRLDGGLTRGDLLLSFSQSGEHAALLGNATTYGIQTLEMGGAMVAPEPTLLLERGDIGAADAVTWTEPMEHVRLVGSALWENHCSLA